MSRDEYHRSAAVDLLTLILCLPFCLWLGWWGVVPAFAIGFAINIWRSHATPAAQAATDTQPIEGDKA